MAFSKIHQLAFTGTRDVGDVLMLQPMFGKGLAIRFIDHILEISLAQLLPGASEKFLAFPGAVELHQSSLDGVTTDINPNSMEHESRLAFPLRKKRRAQGSGVNTV